MNELQINGPVSCALVYRDQQGQPIPASQITGTIANVQPAGIVTVSLSVDNTQLTITPVSGVSGKCTVQVDASAGEISLDSGQILVHSLDGGTPNYTVNIVP